MRRVHPPGSLARFAVSRGDGLFLLALAEGFSRARARLGVLNGAFALSSLWGLIVVILSTVPGIVFAAATAFLFRDNQTALGAVMVVGMLIALFGMVVAMLWYCCGSCSPRR